MAAAMAAAAMSAIVELHIAEPEEPGPLPPPPGRAVEVLTMEPCGIVDRRSDPHLAERSRVREPRQARR